MNDKPQAGSISEAAVELDEALQTFERAAGTAIRAPLRTQKHIDKAVASLDEAASAQTRVVELLQTLMARFTDAGTRSQATSEALDARSTEIATRAEEAAALLRRFDALGEQAHDISSSVRQVNASDRAAAGAHLTELEDKLRAVADEAQRLQTDAQTADLSDLAQQADALRQQILASRNKVSLAAAKLRAS